MNLQHEQMVEQCGICGRALNQPSVVESWDCAGHCLQCMADCGDPDCIEILRKAKDPSSRQQEMARYEDWRMKHASNPTRLGVLLSGRGSNFLAIAESICSGRLPGVEIAIVISNNRGAPGIAAAERLGLPTAVFESRGRSREAHDTDLISCLREHRADLVCLAGYMRLLSPAFIAAFPDRILNIHPSLLPSFPGLNAQQQAFDYGVKVAGCTVHFVDEHLDHGAIILQRAIPVLDTDDAPSLAERILAEEHIAYSEAIARVVGGQYEIQGRRYVPRTSQI